MFRSSSFHTIDAKGRIIVPARFKSDLLSGQPKDQVKDMGNGREKPGVMISNRDECLYAYTFEEWEKVENRILAAKSSNMADFRRFFLGNSCECMLDSQDRILIPKSLREYACLEKEIVLVGNLDHFEIWNRAKWEEVNKRTEQKLKEPDVREEIASIGL